MVALLLVAVSLGFSNFAAAMGIGVTGIDSRTRLRVGVIFGAFEAGMPIIGLLLGHSLASTLGHAAHWIGAGLLIATGLYALAQTLRGRNSRQPGDLAVETETSRSIGQMLVTGLALIVNIAVVGIRSGLRPAAVGTSLAIIVALSLALIFALATPWQGAISVSGSPIDAVIHDLTTGYFR